MRPCGLADRSWHGLAEGHRLVQALTGEETRWGEVLGTALSGFASQHQNSPVSVGRPGAELLAWVLYHLPGQVET